MPPPTHLTTSSSATRLISYKGHPAAPMQLFTYLNIYISTYLPIYLLTYLPTYLFTYLPIYLLTYLPIYQPTWLPNQLPTAPWEPPLPPPPLTDALQHH